MSLEMPEVVRRCRWLWFIINSFVNSADHELLVDRHVKPSDRTLMWLKCNLLHRLKVELAFEWRLSEILEVVHSCEKHSVECRCKLMAYLWLQFIISSKIPNWSRWKATNCSRYNQIDWKLQISPNNSSWETRWPIHIKIESIGGWIELSEMLIHRSPAQERECCPFAQIEQAFWANPIEIKREDVCENSLCRVKDKDVVGLNKKRKLKFMTSPMR